MEQIQNGLVITDQSGFFQVEAEDGNIYICRLRGRLLEEANASDVCAIGDRVKIGILSETTGTIEHVEPRTSVISRALRTAGNRGAGSPEREQVIIANADQAFFVFAATDPAPSPRMIDRFLVMGEKVGIDCILVVNKIDLNNNAENPDHLIQRFKMYENIGYRVLYTSAVDGTGVEALRELLKDKISVFTGPSGVGKTSLLNRMQEGLGRSVKAVSGYNQEGVHTTRDSILIKLDQGGYIADTPGLRNLTIWDVEPEELDAYFIEIGARVPDCRFADCKHENEPRCAVREAVERGEISQSRYKSYLALRAEITASYVIS